ncbi:UBX domain-containing protein 4 [Lingula anatina]|uniref:UBX domain-containing protein 4 n=1 Tax=Lingula anatina TaxID=7574 RepID=A0A1S3HGL5_LINAN|nr:UBX domain-containing protein 4 [Lingula anatina]|eukprot:XP_013385210.1 UBX domain-containing protein 4 [Lingula anatina]
MKWFTGGIPEAILKAKTSLSVFIVYVSGYDEVSKKMDETWEDSAVSRECEEGHCVGIKLQANSEECQQFSQLYPVVCIPSAFFIGNNGVPIEITGGHIEPAQFAAKIKNVVQMHQLLHPQQQQQQQQQQLSQPSTETAATVTAATVTAVAGASAQVPASSEDKQLEEDSSPVQRPGESASDLEARVERAKQLIEMNRIKKAKQKEEEEKRKEVERRNLGRDMARFREMKAEAEAKELRDQMKKDKEEEKLARKRVKEQIEKDRLERKARYEKEKQEKEKAKNEAREAKEEEQRRSLEAAEAVKRETARIQFRLPDGSALTEQFPSHQPLQAAKDFVCQKLGSSFGPFQLQMTYPHRTFVDSDMQTSFLDLQLAPSAVILVKPGKASSSVKPSGGDSGLIALILAPFLWLWGILCSMLFGSPSQPKGAYNSPQEAQSPRQQQSTQQTDPSPLTSSSTRLNRPKTAYKRRTPISTTEGNVHKFNNPGDEDDDTATWNGNSTQQM